MFFKTIPSLTSEAAKILVDAALAHARSQNWHVAVCVVNAQGIPIQAVCMDEAPMTAQPMAEAKAITALREGRSTTTSANRAAKRPGIVKFPGYMPVGGGLPVPEFREDFTHLTSPRYAGAIGISGRTSEEDELVANYAIEALREAWHKTIPTPTPQTSWSRGGGGH